MTTLCHDDVVIVGNDDSDANNNLKFLSNNDIWYRGYCRAARGYEFYLWVFNYRGSAANKQYIELNMRR